MKIDKSRTYATKSGHEVRIYSTDGRGTYPVHGAIKVKDGWADETWTIEGWYEGPGIQNLFNLVEVKPRIKLTRWVNINSYDMLDHFLYSSKEDADKYAHDNRVACVKIEIDCESGEGL
jgi:hypothetical protein